MTFPSLNKLLYGNQFIGIEIFSLNDGQNVAVLNIKKENNELIITQKESRSSIDKLTKKIAKNHPIALIINNNNIIQKEVDSIEINELKILGKAFPNLKVVDFYYEISTLNSKSIVAICRKSYVDELILSYKLIDIPITKISLGVCSISSIVSFNIDPILKTNTQQVDSANEVAIIKPIEKNLVSTYDINGLAIESTFLMCFSGIFNLVIGIQNRGSIVELNSRLYNTFYQYSFFNKALKAIIYVLLSILLINFFTFNYYFKKANDTATSLNANKNIIKKIKVIKAHLKIKNEKVANYINSSNSRSSKIISELIKPLPNSILLSELIFHPLEKKIKQEEAIVTQNNIILISGVTSNNEAFTNWVEEIEHFNWLKNVTIVNYGKNEVKETVFTLKLNCKENEAQ